MNIQTARVTTSLSDVHISSHICSFSQIQYFSKVKKKARVSMSLRDIHILVTLAHYLTIDIYQKWANDHEQKQERCTHFTPVVELFFNPHFLEFFWGVWRCDRSTQFKLVVKLFWWVNLEYSLKNVSEWASEWFVYYVYIIYFPSFLCSNTELLQQSHQSFRSLP